MIENEIAQRIAAGATGSGLAVWMARVTGVDLVVMFLGGLAASWKMDGAEWHLLATPRVPKQAPATIMLSLSF